MMLITPVTMENLYCSTFRITYMHFFYICPSTGKLDSCCLPPWFLPPLHHPHLYLRGLHGSTGTFQDWWTLLFHMTLAPIISAGKKQPTSFPGQWPPVPGEGGCMMPPEEQQWLEEWEQHSWVLLLQLGWEPHSPAHLFTTCAASSQV